MLPLNPSWFPSMDTLVIAVILLVVYWLECEGIGKWRRETEAQTERQALMLFPFPGAQGRGGDILKEVLESPL